MATRSVLRHVRHRITQHPDTDVTFEAECLWCEWKAMPSTDGAAVDVECMSHTGRSGHKGFRRIWFSRRIAVIAVRYSCRPADTLIPGGAATRNQWRPPRCRRHPGAGRCALPRTARRW